MKLIPLSQKYKCKNSKLAMFAMVDDEDYCLISKFNWYFDRGYKRNYASRSTKSEAIDGRRKTVKICMHRVIMKVSDGKILIDHKDGDGLNNQKKNLRIATASQNNANRNKYKKSTSKYLGVSISRKSRSNSWNAKITKDNKRIHLGSFPFTDEGEVLAAKAYDAKAKELHGEFANLNFKPQ